MRKRLSLISSSVNMRRDGARFSTFGCRTPMLLLEGTRLGDREKLLYGATVAGLVSALWRGGVRLRRGDGVVALGVM